MAENTFEMPSVALAFPPGSLCLRSRLRLEGEGPAQTRSKTFKSTACFPRVQVPSACRAMPLLIRGEPGFITRVTLLVIGGQGFNPTTL